MMSSSSFRRWSGGSLGVTTVHSTPKSFSAARQPASAMVQNDAEPLVTKATLICSSAGAAGWSRSTLQPVRLRVADKTHTLARMLFKRPNRKSVVDISALGCGEEQLGGESQCVAGQMASVNVQQRYRKHAAGLPKGNSTQCMHSSQTDPRTIISTVARAGAIFGGGTRSLTKCCQGSGGLPIGST